MAALILNDFSLPNEMAEGIFKKAQTGSVISQLSGARPQKFGKQSVMVLSGAPKAEIVGEGATKSPTPTTYTTKTVTPLKLQVTMRFSQEVMWADEDAQIGVLQDLSENAGHCPGAGTGSGGHSQAEPAGRHGVLPGDLRAHRHHQVRHPGQRQV